MKAVLDIEDKNSTISEIMNLIGYGLAKFSNEFVHEFGFKSKSAFYRFVIASGFAKTEKAVSNRQDSFDPYFDNHRKGWWQRNQREHIKLLIDSLFGKEDCKSYVNIVKLYMKDFDNALPLQIEKVKPVIRSKFKELQKTGNEAEFFFMQNFRSIPVFENGIIEDARLWGDGYDFQIQLENDFVLAEIKGVRDIRGAVRFTENEYKKAKEYMSSYFLVVVSNLAISPRLKVIVNPVEEICFSKKEVNATQINYHSGILKW